MKKLLGIFMAAVTVFAACAGFVGCKKDKTGQEAEEPPKTEEPAGTTYLLRLAYNEGFLTKEDLEQIAYYNNNGVKPEVPLDAAIEQEIKETLAYEMRRNHPEINNVTADGFPILKYYGEYHGCYVFMESNGYLFSPAVMPEGEFYYVIDSVHFNISTTEIKVWKANNR